MLTGDDSRLPFAALYSLRSHLLRHPTLSLLTALAIATSVAMATALEMSTSAVTLELDRTAAALAGSSTFEIWASKGVPEDLLSRLEHIPGVETATPLIHWNVRVSQGQLANMRLHVLGLDFTAERKLRRYAISDGGIEIRDPVRLLGGANSVIVTREFLDRSGLELGDPFPVLWEGVPRELVPQGVLLPGGIADAYGGQVAAMDVYAVQELVGRRGWFDRIDVAAVPGTDLAELRDAITRAAGGLAMVDLAESPDEFADRAFGALRLAVWLFAILGIVVAVLLGYTTISHAVDRRTRQFATLQSIGLEPRRVRRIVWTDTALMGMLGTAAGVPAGFLLSRSFLSSFSDLSEMLVKVEVEQVTLRASTLAAALGVGILVSLLACLEPGRRATSRPPLEILRTTRQPGTGPPNLRAARHGLVALCLGALLLASLWVDQVAAAVRLGVLFTTALLLVLLFVVPLMTRLVRVGLPLCETVLSGTGSFLGWSLQVRPFHTALTLGSLAGVTGALASLFIVLEGTERSLETWTSTRYPGGVLVTGEDPFASTSWGSVFPRQLVQRVHRLGGADTVLEVFSRTLPFRGHATAIVACQADVLARRGKLPLVEGESADVMRALVRGDVVVSEPFARRFGVGIGDRIELATPSGRAEFPIAGITREFEGPHGSITLDLQVYDRHWPRPGTSLLVLWPRGSYAELEDEVRETVGPAFPVFFTRASFQADFARRTIARFLSLLYVLGGMSALLGGVGVVNLMMAITLERRRDLALLRVAGATRSQAVGLVVGDSLLVGLAGASVGVLLALPVSAFMTAILSDTFGWMIDRTLTGAPIWIFLGVLAVSGAAGLLPALAVRRIAPAESLLAD